MARRADSRVERGNSGWDDAQAQRGRPRQPVATGWDGRGTSGRGNGQDKLASDAHAQVGSIGARAPRGVSCTRTLKADETRVWQPNSGMQDEEDLRSILRALGARLVKLQQCFDERIDANVGAGFEAICKHVDARFDRIEERMETVGRIQKTKSTGAGAWLGGFPPEAQGSISRQFIETNAGKASEATRFPEVEDGGDKLRLQRREEEEDAGRKRIKERLKEALELQEAGIAGNKRRPIKEFLFGICKPDRRIGKLGSRCAAAICCFRGWKQMILGCVPGSSILSRCLCKVLCVYARTCACACACACLAGWCF